MEPGSINLTALPLSLSTTRTSSAQGAASSPGSAPTELPHAMPHEREPEAERRLTDLMQEVEALAPRVSQATLQAAASHLSALASLSRRHESDGGDSPIQPAALTFTNLAGSI